MIHVETNLGTVAAQFLARGAAVPPAIRRALRTIGIQVERGASKRTSGAGDPGAYPVPRRTGNLNRSISPPIMGHRRVTVEATAGYAAAVHEGFRAFGNPNAPYYPGRPFMRDAAEDVDAVGEIIAELESIP